MRELPPAHRSRVTPRPASARCAQAATGRCAPRPAVRLLALCCLFLTLLTSCVQPVVPTATPGAATRATGQPQTAVTGTPPGATAVATPTQPGPATATPTRPLLPTFTPTPGATPRPLQQTTNLLILGSDRRGGKGTGRTDVILLAAIDFTQGRAGVISIPRDLWVQIPGVGRQRINTADVYGEQQRPGGGVALVKRTIQDNLGLPVDKYVRVDFGGFERIVDALGGITVTMDCPMHEVWDDPDAPGGVVELDYEPGDHFLDGQHALWYVRTRRRGNDLDRARRQQRVLLGLKQRAEETNLLAKTPELFDALRDAVDTDLTLLDVLALARLGVGLRREEIHSRVFDFEMAQPYTTPGGAAVLLPNKRAIQEAFDHIWDAPDVIEATRYEQRCP